MEKEPDVANITRMARAIIEIVNDQDRDDVIRALISVMVPMFVYAPEPRSDAVRQIKRRYWRTCLRSLRC